MVTTRRMAWKRKSCSYDDVEAHARPGDRAYEAGCAEAFQIDPMLASHSSAQCSGMREPRSLANKSRYGAGWARWTR